MISNLPLHQTEIKRGTGARIIALSSSALSRYVLCIGEDGFFNSLTGKEDERVFTVDSIALSRKVLKEQLQKGIAPSFIICNITERLFNLGSLRDFLRAHAALSAVPVFVYANTITVEVREELRKIGGIDDVMTMGTTPQLFASKLQTARKIREMANKAAQVPAKRTFRPFRPVDHFLKRLMDITAAGTALVLLSPLFLVIAVLIKLESKGPVFYIARRAGNGYRIFKFYKFRTMVTDADKQVSQMAHLNQYDANAKGPVFFKVSNDPRVTRLGSFLRNTSLDEIPQLLNVLLGHMSLVGNRPLPLYEAATLTTDDYAGRFLAPAGMTGLWQIKKRGNKDMSVTERINLDINYAEKHSLLYDLWILANTPNALIQKDNV